MAAPHCCLVDAATLSLVLVIVTALAFDFTNGFHDTANAMAASISTGALKPKVAVGLSAILNLVGAFLSVQVALTVTNAVINLQDKSGAPKAELLADGGEAVLLIILAGLAGGILWNLFTWLLGLPSSSSHALLGGLTGAGAAGLGWAGVKWSGDGSKLDGVVGKILLPSLISPIIALTVAFTGCWLVHKVTRSVIHRLEERYFRYGQVGSASLVSIAHGTNDAQKTMGVMTLALIASGHWTSTTSIPVWVKFSAATAIAAGTYLGGWRIIRTLGKGLVDITPRQGMSSDGATAAVLLSASHLGFALSTTHVATGSVLGGGMGRGTPVRWSTAGRMVTAWATTFPIAALMGALLWWIGDSIGGAWGALAVFLLLTIFSGWIFRNSRRERVSAENVNDSWDRAAEITSPTYEHAPVTHGSNRSGPPVPPGSNGSGRPVPPGSNGSSAPVPPGSNGSSHSSPDGPETPDGDREPTKPAENKTH
jgi:PiT family inorganic phosphate transporter